MNVLHRAQEILHDALTKFFLWASSPFPGQHQLSHDTVKFSGMTFLQVQFSCVLFLAGETLVNVKNLPDVHDTTLK